MSMFRDKLREQTARERERILYRRLTVLERLMNRYRIGTILVASFAMLIVLGTLLLALPVSNASRTGSLMTHWFVATSAVCVTGLSPVTVAEQYTLFGKCVILVLMQVGGLGLMTFVAMIISLGRKKASLMELRGFAEAEGKQDYYDITGYIRRIVKYTAFFELLGFIFLSIRFVSDFGTARGLFNAFFVSVAAFTNAGFDCFASDSLAGYATDPLVSLTVMVLIVVGGLGFIVWIEIREHMKRMKEKRLPRRFFFTSFSIHTKIVVIITVILILLGTVLFMAAEYTNPGTIGNRTLPEKLLISLFQSVTLRTAGFSSVSIGACTRFTLLVMCPIMLVGGSPGGTAGGFKTTTLVVIAMIFRNSIGGDINNTNLMHRRIRKRDFVHAELVLSAYMMFLFLGVCVLIASEPSISTMGLIYEAVSAIATVGLSASVTSSLSVVGKLVIICLMFIGRLGPIAMLELFRREPDTPHREHIEYPSADIMVG